VLLISDELPAALPPFNGDPTKTARYVNSPTVLPGV